MMIKGSATTATIAIAPTAAPIAKK